MFPAIKMLRRPLDAARSQRDEPQTAWTLWPLTMVLGGFIAHIFAFVWLFPHIGASAGIIVSVPVIFAAWVWGIRVGLLATLVAWVANLALVETVTGMSATSWFLYKGGFLGLTTLTLVVLAIGRLRGLERERAIATRRMQRLSWRLAEGKEEQSRHIARELHDQIGQQLTGLKLQLEIGDAAAIEKAREITRDLMQRVRNLSLELRPMILDDLGLGAGLRDQLARYTELTGIRVHLEDDLDSRPDPTVEVAAYRIVQEALTNVARHAGVSEASVSVTMKDDKLRVCVEDEGRGMPRGWSSGEPGASGISSMRERARAVNGRIEIVGKPGEGTRVTAVLPKTAPAVEGEDAPEPEAAGPR